MRSGGLFKKIIYAVLLCFMAATIVPEPALVMAAETGLPAPDQILPLSSSHWLPVIRGVYFDPEDPLNLRFVFDTGNEKTVEKETAERLIRYFLAALAIPEDDLWVNLSPYESDRIVPETLGETDLGRDMLAQDYVLKQLSSSLMYPEAESGQQYWQKLYAEAVNSGMPESTFNKVWIAPDKADIYEDDNGTSAFIIDARLKAMLEADYLAAEKNEAATGGNAAAAAMRSAVLPKISEEINNGANFAPLRQLYHSLILGVWFKKKFAETFYRNYFDSGAVAGIDIEDKDAKQKIYDLYVEAFKKGVFNYERKERDALSGRTVKRHYFSGGIKAKVSPEINALPGVSSPISFIRKAFVGTAMIAFLGMFRSADVQAEYVNVNLINVSMDKPDTVIVESKGISKDSVDLRTLYLEETPVVWLRLRFGDKVFLGREFDLLVEDIPVLTGRVSDSLDFRFTIEMLDKAIEDAGLPLRKYAKIGLRFTGENAAPGIIDGFPVPFRSFVTSLKVYGFPTMEGYDYAVSVVDRNRRPSPAVPGLNVRFDKGRNAFVGSVNAPGIIKVYNVLGQAVDVFPVMKGEFTYKLRAELADQKLIFRFTKQGATPEAKTVGSAVMNADGRPVATVSRTADGKKSFGGVTMRSLGNMIVPYASSAIAEVDHTALTFDRISYSVSDLIELDLTE